MTKFIFTSSVQVLKRVAVNFASDSDKLRVSYGFRPVDFEGCGLRMPENNFRQIYNLKCLKINIIVIFKVV